MNGITNALIKSVTVNEKMQDKVPVEIVFDIPFEDVIGLELCLTNPIDNQRLESLMKYAGVSKVEDLTGRVVRQVNYGSYLLGLGHPIKNKFVPTFTEDFMEINTSRFEELLKMYEDFMEINPSRSEELLEMY